MGAVGSLRSEPESRIPVVSDGLQHGCPAALSGGAVAGRQPQLWGKILPGHALTRPTAVRGSGAAPTRLLPGSDPV